MSAQGFDERVINLHYDYYYYVCIYRVTPRVPSWGTLQQQQQQQQKARSSTNEPLLYFHSTELSTPTTKQPDIRIPQRPELPEPVFRHTLPLVLTWLFLITVSFTLGGTGSPISTAARAWWCLYNSRVGSSLVFVTSLLRLVNLPYTSTQLKLNVAVVVVVVVVDVVVIVIVIVVVVRIL